MKSFEYARPTTESEAVEFLNIDNGQTAVLAGGTDLTSLLPITTTVRSVFIGLIGSLTRYCAAPTDANRRCHHSECAEDSRAQSSRAAVVASLGEIHC